MAVPYGMRTGGLVTDQDRDAAARARGGAY